ncbi:uncharacterized protein LOC134177231 isoform X2 [Corticium candelabrum]|uniref:uncharacterized protein LOC134177231 isoform X2 n=1 Tax=Corticium candelabrum TaxID=121492 RepID=UPI002E267085|nr:uncharacterized protein LOC134177231 isoform X2 [Corticium candelabrum]
MYECTLHQKGLTCVWDCEADCCSRSRMSNMIRAILHILVIFASFNTVFNARGYDESEDKSDEYIEQDSHLGVPDVIFVGVHGDYKLHINGELQKQEPKPGSTVVYMVPYKQSHLIAVELKMSMRGQSQEIYQEAGLIASIETVIPSVVSVSNSRWRCTNKRLNLIDSFGKEWIDNDFIDSAWSPAEELAANGEMPFGVAVDVTSQAKWIWADVPASKVYCRGWLSAAPDTLHIAAHGQIKVYADNMLLGFGNKSGEKYTFVMPSAPLHLVAIEVKGDKKMQRRGVLASLQMPAHPNGVSGDLWKCITAKNVRNNGKQQVHDWSSVVYDDSEWPAVKVVGKHGDPPWGFKLEVSRHSSWVWTKDNSDKIYCRARMTSEFGSDKAESDGEEDRQEERRQPLPKGQEKSRPLLPMNKRPPETIVTIDASELTIQNFFQKFVATSTPVVIKNGMKDWPALRKWTDKYLTSVVGDHPSTITYSNSTVFHFYGQKREFKEKTIGDFLKEFSATNRQGNLYMAQQPIMKELPELESDIRRPKFSDILKLQDVYLWMGAGDQVTPAHFDNSENILCMVAGRKKLRLYHPSMSPFLYAEVQNRYTAITSAVFNLTHVDYNKFPDFQHAKHVFVEIKKGDMLFLPAYWWHEVTSYDRNIAINWWFDAHSDTMNQFFEHWVAKLPQTKWGKQDEDFRRYEIELAKEEGQEIPGQESWRDEL